MKKIAFLLAILMLFPLIPVSAETDAADGPRVFLPWFDSVETFDSETIPLYYLEPENKHELTIRYVNGEKQLPYISLGAMADVLKLLYGGDYQLDVAYDSGIGVLTRENGAIGIIDPKTDTISLFDANRFKVLPNAVSCLDILETGKKGLNLTLISGSKMSETSNVLQNICLGDYCVDIIEHDGEIHLPLQTFFDFFINNAGLTMSAFYNGKCVVIGSSMELINLGQTSKDAAESITGPVPEDQQAENDAAELFEESTLVSIYMDTEPRVKSENLIRFNFNELCAALDYTYGLKEKHGITNFKDVFIRYGLMDALWSESPKSTYDVLTTLAYTVFADKHSASTMLSPYSATGLTDDDLLNIMIATFVQLEKAGPYAQIRAEKMGEEIPAYCEIGNTAFITFDTFMMDAETDYYSAELKNDASDTITLLMYANEQLHRENCPIENVVLDLTNNGGGAADAAICVISFFLGKAEFNITDNITGAQSSTVYSFDADRDGEHNIAKDSVAHLNRYCLTGSTSFSCGNLVPAAFKSSDSVTLIGRTTGGGACAVCGLTTADGNGMVISSPFCINNVVNGTYYDVDKGIAPDIYVSKLANLYDRELLAEYINGLF